MGVSMITNFNAEYDYKMHSGIMGAKESNSSSHIVIAELHKMT
jgi:hypothetical protein